MQPPKVTVAHPVAVPVQGYYEYNGHLDAVEMVEIKARVKGLLQEVHFKEGDEVEAGTKLYTIDPREYKTAAARSSADVAKAIADIDNWKAQIKLAEADLERTNRAASTGAASMTEVDKARATLDVNKAQYAVAVATKESAQASLQTSNIQLGYTDIRAPIAGRISRTLVTKGNLVGQDEPTLLTTIVAVDPVYVYFDAPERDLIEYMHELRKMPVPGAAPVQEAVIEMGVSTEEGYPHKGIIDFRENKVDANTGTVRIRGRIPNPPAPPLNARLLYPGLYARVRVPSGGPVVRPVIPEDALMTGQEGRFVYVLGADNKIEKRVVTLGTKVWQAAAGPNAPPGWALVNPNPPPPAPPGEKGAPPAPIRVPLKAVVAINSGLEIADRIVVVGLQRARVNSPVTPEDWVIKPPVGEPQAGK
jgi:multidrug efflux system membrane fusion protein